MTTKLDRIEEFKREAERRRRIEKRFTKDLQAVMKKYGVYVEVESDVDYHAVYFRGKDIYLLVDEDLNQTPRKVKGAK